MKDSEIAVNDRYKVTWKNAITSKVDIERLKSERPDIYHEYCKRINVRRLLIKAA